MLPQKQTPANNPGFQAGVKRTSFSGFSHLPFCARFARAKGEMAMFFVFWAASPPKKQKTSLLRDFFTAWRKHILQQE